MSEKKRDYQYLSATHSLCSICGNVVPAKVIRRGTAIYLLKNCLNHGMHEEILEDDANFYLRQKEYDIPGDETIHQTETVQGCPYDCGLCPDHEQHTCIALLEITQSCDLCCPNCYANSGAGDFIPLERVNRILDAFLEAESGRAEILQVSGGEPTLHPEVLDIIQLALDKGIRYVMLNTNGLRIAHDFDFAQSLSRFRERFEVYLQFDGFGSETSRVLRGKDILEDKMKALENLIRVKVPVTLVTTVAMGVNDHELGEILRFGLRTSMVRGINFQPFAFFGRVGDISPNRRITRTGVLRRLEEQTDGILKMGDFVPLPCDVDRVAITMLLRDHDTYIPLTRKADIRKYLTMMDNTLQFQLQDLLSNATNEIKCNPCKCDCLSFMRDFIPLSSLAAKGLILKDREILSRDVFRITVTSFLDRYNFEMKAMKKECVHVLTPDLRRIPFSAYNLIHRRNTADAISYR